MCEERLEGKQFLEHLKKLPQSPGQSLVTFKIKLQSGFDLQGAEKEKACTLFINIPQARTFLVHEETQA